jgi:dihydropteroate synthase
MPTKRSAKDRAAEQADYVAWKILAGADLLQRHDVKPGTIPERLWRRLYIQGRTPHDAADKAAVSAHNTRPAADRLRRR